MNRDRENILKIKNGQAISLSEISVLEYREFYAMVLKLMDAEDVHCVNYYAYPDNNNLKFICFLADDRTQSVYLLSHILLAGKVPGKLESLTSRVNALHIFEREIWENFGVEFEGHPWLKPVRFSHNRYHRIIAINDYPFYKIKGEELHEVGVGPIHAGVIEPGHFRFTCNGEMVLHLEIQLGWQHRGVERLFLEKPKLLQMTILAESIAGDTTIGHTLAFAQVMEGLAGISANSRLDAERAVALELERIAVHTGDISALCTDVAYQLGAAVFGALRTPIINFTQSWCGNRFGKGLIRAGGSHYSLTDVLVQQLRKLLDDFEWRFKEMADKAYSLLSVENRFDNIGTVTNKQARLIGAVGMAARASGVKRDIRHSHPFAAFRDISYVPVMLERGDVYARYFLRRREIEESISYIRRVLDREQCFFSEATPPVPETSLNLLPSSITVSMVEGWRGEICHSAVTDEQGKIIHYKIKDPSMHNWKAVELSLRGLEISDFPINNKSYDLSYCGHDL
ncbi:MAG: NADH-quinone oxidoreductase subunit C [Candidatus Scalindua sp.]|nr:NADH-quinone oxidoreductase subunit C [Candidatus Scalindua sp.]